MLLFVVVWMLQVVLWAYYFRVDYKNYSEIAFSLNSSR